MHLKFTLALALPLVTLPVETLPCIPEGKGRDIEFERPALPGIESAEWDEGSGTPDAWDSDQFSGDDLLGSGVPSADGSKASIHLQNSAGELFGPNGEDVEGGLEGECLEIHMSWWYSYRQDQTVSFTVGDAPFTITITKLLRGVKIIGWAESEQVKICPC